MASRVSRTEFSRLGAFTEDGADVNVVIETPQGSRNKFNYDEELGLFKLGGVLPAGAVFPFDFGFVPETTGGDGDPLDVLVLMDEPAFPGCLVSRGRCRFRARRFRARRLRGFRLPARRRRAEQRERRDEECERR